MSAKTQSPYPRLIALAALILAAGLLSFRAYDVFGGVKSDPVGSALERELTYLLEPITGAEKGSRLRHRPCRPHGPGDD